MKKLGFGMMRLPMIGEEIDLVQVSKMVDEFFLAGFRYFDTAHGYIKEMSEHAVKECLTSRYNRSAYELTDKLTISYIKEEKEIRPFFQSQLEATGVTYFDTYLFHAVNKTNYERFKAANAFSIVEQLKKEGKIKRIGMSFHDQPEVLDRILSEQPVIEVVQLQFNYADYDNPMVESKRCYEVCKKHNKPVLVMEPVKGGSLVNLPKEAADILDAAGNGSYASYAIRYAASHDAVEMVLSGMSDIAQMRDNISYMKDFVPFTNEEYEAVAKVREILKKQDVIPCTACCYCVEGCPKHILIPELFSCFNDINQFHDPNSKKDYVINTTKNGKASDCIKCGKCEAVCPQHLEIRKLLSKVARVFD